MKIVMFTNTYLPHVGGVATSVDRFSKMMRRDGHEVLIVAPRYEGKRHDEKDVHRVPSMKHFSGSDFSVALPLDLEMADRLDAFDPDIIHSHHPFLLGNSAVRYAASHNLPLVFTHHTMYEHYTHYVPIELEAMKQYIIRMSTGYANFCDAVVAPSQSTAEILKERGVTTPIHVAPTGVNVNSFADGDGAAERRRQGIPTDASLIGTVGRLAPEKNLEFLAQSVAEALRKDQKRWFLAGGSGPSEHRMRKIFADADVDDRVRFAGVLKDRRLRDAYHALDVFAFASKTETQGMVLVEALATGCPIVALDAPGAREVVKNGDNGELLETEDIDAFAEAVGEIASQHGEQRAAMRRQARKSAKPFDIGNCVDRVLEVYCEMLEQKPHEKKHMQREWKQFVNVLRKEWDIWSNRVQSISEAILKQEQER